MTLLGVLLSSSAPAFNVLGPFKTNKTNAPPSSSVEAYLDGYRQGYSLGYYECGPFTIDYPGPFAEAFIRGQRRGQTNGWEDAEAERRERLRLEQEREATGQPYNVTHCHCLDCRRSSGAPFRRSDFRFTAGQARELQWAGRLRSFCPYCGTPLTFIAGPAADEVDVTVCSFDHAAAITPT